MAKIVVENTEIAVISYFEFASWVSPQFKLFLIREFQRLKDNEQKMLGWSANMENINAVSINDNVPQKDRLLRLNKIAIHQMTVLVEVERRKLLK
jgi:hypothetical protein